MAYSLGEWFKLYVFPSGRREFALRQMAAQAEAQGFAELVGHCQAAVEHEKLVRQQKRELASARQQRANPRLAELDSQIDRSLGGIYRRASDAQLIFAGTELGAQAELLLSRLFPLGAADITSRAYVEQSAEVRSLLDELQGPLQGAAEQLGLRPDVDQLQTLNLEFQTLLAEQRSQRVSPDQLRAAEAQGQENLLQAVARILGRYPESSAAHLGARQQLLQAVAQQNEAIRSYLRHRRAVRDVEPESGQEQPAEPEPIAPATPDVPVIP